MTDDKKPVRTRKVYRVRATNRVTGRIDYHEDLSWWDFQAIRAIPTVYAEIVETTVIDR